jgi:hypothetical protein
VSKITREYSKQSRTPKRRPLRVQLVVREALVRTRSRCISLVGACVRQHPARRVAIINGLDKGGQLTAGQWVKRVTGGVPGGK